MKNHEPYTGYNSRKPAKLQNYLTQSRFCTCCYRFFISQICWHQKRKRPCCTWNYLCTKLPRNRLLPNAASPSKPAILRKGRKLSTVSNAICKKYIKVAAKKTACSVTSILI